MPSSKLVNSFMGVLELVKLMVGKEITSRMLRVGDIPLMIGRNKGRQAPTIPSEDSTIGQYTVGVNKSFGQQVSQSHYFQEFGCLYM